MSSVGSIGIARTNTILYCASWHETVRFYREVIGLDASLEKDWFVEFSLGPASFLSVADAARATIGPAHGAGLTLSWEVADLDRARTHLVASDVELSPTRRRWDAESTYFTDPEGNRIELWSPLG